MNGVQGAGALGVVVGCVIRHGLLVTTTYFILEIEIQMIENSLFCHRASKRCSSFTDDCEISFIEESELVLSLFGIIYGEILSQILISEFSVKLFDKYIAAIT